MSVRPVITFEAPEFVVPPALVHVWCSVKRANPNFFMVVKENGLREALRPVWGVTEYGVYNQHINRTIRIVEPQKNYIDLNCTVTWEKEYTVRDIIEERRRIQFYCK